MQARTEEPATIRIRVRDVDHIMLAKARAKELVLGAVERPLEKGDKALLTTQSKQSLKVVMTGEEIRSPIAIHEYIHFNALGHIGQMSRKPEAEEGLYSGAEEE